MELTKIIKTLILAKNLVSRAIIRTHIFYLEILTVFASEIFVFETNRQKPNSKLHWIIEFRYCQGAGRRIIIVFYPTKFEEKKLAKKLT